MVRPEFSAAGPHNRWWKWVLVGAWVARVVALYASGQLYTTEYWEYGQIARQLAAGWGYRFPFVDQHLHFLPGPGYPSALMPPGYVFFLYPFLAVPSVFWANFLLFHCQIGLSVGAIYLSWRWASAQLGFRIAFIASILQAFLPVLVYTPATVGPTAWFHFLVALFLFGFQPRRSVWWQAAAVLGAALLVAMRTEALLFFVAYSLFRLKEGEWKKQLVLFFAIGLLLCPWLYRNLTTFGKPILSTSFGINLYRGNNPQAIGEWPPVFNQAYNQMIHQPQTFEPQYNAYTTALALAWACQHPTQWAARIPEKFFRFWAVDWGDTRARHPANWMPWVVLLLCGLPEAFGKTHAFQNHRLLCVVYTVIILVFFPQLRYLSLVQFFWMPMAAGGMWRLYERLKNDS